MTAHIDTRRKLKEIPTRQEFEGLLNKSTLSPEDKALMYMHYLDGKDFRFIGDSLGFSEQTIKYRHRKILRKIGNMITLLLTF